MEQKKEHLTDAQIEEAAQSVIEKKPIYKPEQLDEESLSAVNSRIKEILEATEPEPQAEPVSSPGATGDQDDMAQQGQSDSFDPEGKPILPGGVQAPDGYTFVGQFTFDDEFGAYRVTDTLDFVEVHETFGVSLTFEQDRDSTGPINSGVLKGRLIHDGAARVYVFRKDEDDTTYFAASLGHG